MTRRHALLALLADGELQSGQRLAARLGVTRAAIAEQIGALAAWGLEVESLPRRGYRLTSPLELIDAEALQSALGPGARAACDRLEVSDEVGSTNSELLAAGSPPPGCFRAWLAEYQSAGRGRRGRGWVAPYGSGLCLSFGWQFTKPPAGIAALGLATGVAVLRALARCGVGGLALKWPNDILLEGGKLGGILCELRSEAAGPAHVVIGTGLNVQLPPHARAAIQAAGGLAPADLAGRAGTPSRRLLAAALLDELHAMAVEFGTAGFAPFRAEWSLADALRDRPVKVLAPTATREGVARGIDGDGSLCVEVGGRLERLSSGDVTLRAVA